VKPYILVIDDEPDIRRLLREILEDEGYAVAEAKDGQSARDSLAARTPNLILLDIWMPDVDGISLLKEIIEVYKLQCPVVMMSGHGTVEAAVEATRLGACDFIEKPLSLSKLLLTVESALANAQLLVNSHSFQYELNETVELVGKSEAVDKLKKSLVQCAQHAVVVLMRGELGVGKAHCARYIHTHSARKKGNYVELRTATLVDGRRKKILEILLGVESAGVVHVGLWEKANGGTLYIDDVAELDDEIQSALYGILTASAIYRVNGEAPIQSDVRLIVATSHPLEDDVASGLFRADLFHAINGFPIYVEPLRTHSEDVSELVQYYVNIFADRDGLPFRSFSVAVQNRLRNYSWPGNVLELESLVKRLLIQNGSTNVSLDEIEEILSESVERLDEKSPGEIDYEKIYAMPLKQAREYFEKAYLEYHLKQTDGSVGKVAKLAGLERTHLYRKLRALNIDTKQLGPGTKEN
jgi:DNA-binding NtrC family response regulator